MTVHLNWNGLRRVSRLLVPNPARETWVSFPLLLLIIFLCTNYFATSALRSALQTAAEFNFLTKKEGFILFLLFFFFLILYFFLGKKMHILAKGFKERRSGSQRKMLHALPLPLRANDWGLAKWKSLRSHFGTESPPSCFAWIRFYSPEKVTCTC